MSTCTELQVGAGGFMVLRPDSGDPVEAVLMALRAAEKVTHLHDRRPLHATSCVEQTLHTDRSYRARTCKPLLSRVVLA